MKSFITKKVCKFVHFFQDSFPLFNGFKKGEEEEEEEAVSKLVVVYEDPAGMLVYGKIYWMYQHQPTLKL